MHLSGMGTTSLVTRTPSGTHYFEGTRRTMVRSPVRNLSILRLIGLSEDVHSAVTPRAMVPVLSASGTVACNYLISDELSHVLGQVIAYQAITAGTLPYGQKADVSGQGMRQLCGATTYL